MANLILQLKAKHFKGTDFLDHHNCVIAKVFQEKTGLICSELLDELYIPSNESVYKHTWYGDIDFNIDFDLAQSHNFDETVIREIELIEV